MGLGLVVLRSCQVIWAQAHDVGRVDWGLGSISDTVMVKVKVMVMASNAMSDHHQWPLAIGHRPSAIGYQIQWPSSNWHPTSKWQRTIHNYPRIEDSGVHRTADGKSWADSWAYG